MTNNERLEILNRAFVRVYRSFGLYLHDACPVYDIGDERTVQQIQLRQKADADLMGSVLVRERGSIEPGHPRTEFGDAHFLNLSSLLPIWIKEQQKVVEGLTADRKALEPDVDRISGIVDQVLAHERDHLKRLESLASGSLPLAA